MDQIINEDEQMDVEALVKREHSESFYGEKSNEKTEK